jgi:hypothetical protein
MRWNDMAKEGKSINTLLDWLLEPGDPGVRYLALRDIVKAGVKELTEAKKTAHAQGPIAAVLASMNKEGYWGKPGPGYYPLYTSTLWALILLAQLGADITMDKRIATACNYVLDNSLTKYGHFTTQGTPRGTFICTQGNMCWALLELGCTDPRLDTAYEMMTRIVTGEGIAPMTDRKAVLRYYPAEMCGPGYACGATYRKPCAWGAIKILLAYGKLPAAKRTPMMQTAIKMGVDFLLSTDPAKAEYPPGISPKTNPPPSQNWWKFGFPSFYVADILQNVEVLAQLGYGKDKRLANAVQLIKDKQDSRGRWLMEHNYAGRTLVDFGPKKQPNKWVTLRALRVLKMV